MGPTLFGEENDKYIKLLQQCMNVTDRQTDIVPHFHWDSK